MNPFLPAALFQHAHGGRPPASPLEYVLAGMATLAAAYAFVLAVRMTARPGEEEPHHIKRAILEDEPPQVSARLQERP